MGGVSAELRLGGLTHRWAELFTLPLKDHGLAFRQTILSHITTNQFTHPNETWFLSDQVRSGAVPGEDVPAVAWHTVMDAPGSSAKRSSNASMRRW
jgi:hypothetical protein